MAALGAELDISAVDDGFVLRGEIDAHTAPHLESALGDRLEAGSTTVRLHLDAVTFMDSSGLQVITVATERARVAGGDVVLVAPGAAVRKLIELTATIADVTVADVGA